MLRVTQALWVKDVFSPKEAVLGFYSLFDIPRKQCICSFPVLLIIKFPEVLLENYTLKRIFMRTSITFHWVFLLLTDDDPVVLFIFAGYHFLITLRINTRNQIVIWLNRLLLDSSICFALLGNAWMSVSSLIQVLSVKQVHRPREAVLGFYNFAGSLWLESQDCL